MLRIVRSKYASSGREAFCNEIAKLVKEGRRACLIVPEQQTVMAEGMMSRILPPSATLTFEVTNFTRLANTTFRTLGGLSAEYCDSTKKALIMWRALTELSPNLSMTMGRREVSAGLVESSLAAVAQMQSCGIHPGDLTDVAEREEIKRDGRLLAKVDDLAKVYTLYKKLLGDRYSDTGDDAEAMIRKLEENPSFLSDTALFIEGFTSFTEPQYKLISLLSARTSVSVALTLPQGMKEAFEYSEIANCQKRLSLGANKFGANVKIAKEEGYGKKRNQALDEICAALWLTNSTNDNITLQNNDDLRIFQAFTPYEECEFICQDIKRRVIDGASYNDFAIVARNADDYQGILDGALKRAGIPAFTSFRRDINEFEAIKLIYTAYAVARGFKREDVITYAKCSLSGISREECDEFEMYVNKWQISGRRFTDDGIWNMNPDGYTSRKAADMDEKLIRIHNVRERIVGPLASFADSISTATTVREQAEVLLDFLLKIDLDRSLDKRAEKLKSLNENALAEGNTALWKTICKALDTLVTVLGDAPADGEAFLAQLKVVFSATDIGRIPAYIDQLIVGSADMLRLYEKKHIYIIGVNAGKFPANVSDKSYFTDRDRIVLQNCELPIAPELEIKGARELYIFSRAFSYATESVTISYPTTDTKFKSIGASEVIAKIANLTGDKVKPVRIQLLSPSERIFTADSALSTIGEYEECYNELRDALVDTGHERVVSICEGNITLDKVKLDSTIVPEDKSLSLSQTSIDEYLDCPFGYFCKYVMHLGEDDIAEFDARNTGNFIHAILENFFRTIYESGRTVADLTENERIDLTRASAEKHLQELGDDVINASFKTKIKIDRLCRAALPVVDGLCDELSKAKFVPRFFELELDFTEKAVPNPIMLDTDSGKVMIKGKIDRVDAFEKDNDIYLRVIDYKTGNKDFSPDDMKNGSNLQMFLYLKSLVESNKEGFRKALGVAEDGRVLPGGLIYVKTNVRDVKIKTPRDDDALVAVKAAQERLGMAYKDEDVIRAMPLEYSPVYDPGKPDKIPEKSDFLYTDEKWDDFMKSVEATVGRVSGGIRGGVMNVDPKDYGKKTSACTYCKFKPICRK